LVLMGFLGLASFWPWPQDTAPATAGDALIYAGGFVLSVAILAGGIRLPFLRVVAYDDEVVIVNYRHRRMFRWLEVAAIRRTTGGGGPAESEIAFHLADGSLVNASVFWRSRFARYDEVIPGLEKWRRAAWQRAGLEVPPEPVPAARWSAPYQSWVDGTVVGLGDSIAFTLEARTQPEVYPVRRLQLPARIGPVGPGGPTRFLIIELPDGRTQELVVATRGIPEVLRCLDPDLVQGPDPHG
jgi:hypothetical protein